MPMDLHLICPRGHMLQPLQSGLLVPVGDGFNNDMFETGGWEDISTEEANEAVGGRLYLHVAQSREPWHGGTIMDWGGDAGPNSPVATAVPFSPVATTPPCRSSVAIPAPGADQGISLLG